MVKAYDNKKLLENIILTEEPIFHFFDGKEKNFINMKAYVLPVEYNNNVQFALFPLEDRIIRVGVGYKTIPPDLRSRYVMLPAGKVHNTKDSKINYLPVRNLDITTNFRKQKGEFIELRLLGIDGPKGKYPLIIAEIEGEKTTCRILSETPHKGLNILKLHLSKELEEHITKIINPYTKSKPKESTKNKLPETEKSADSSPIISVASELEWHKPKEIVKYLDEYMVGQYEAKKIAAVTFSNYMTKFYSKDAAIEKDNLILIGPSGIGKTYMMSLLAKKASLPLVETKLSVKTSEGYIGENLSSIFEQMASKTKENAPYGIIFLDEIDKLVKDMNGGFMDKLQDSLISWIEDADVSIGSGRRKSKMLETGNILFVAAGAFQSSGYDSIENIVSRRIKKTGQNMGFDAMGDAKAAEDSKKLLSKVRHDDLIEYGLKHELVGRFHNIAVLNTLTDEDKIKILTETPKSPLNHYTALLNSKGYGISIDPEVPKTIVRHVSKSTGARALYPICTDIFIEILYEPDRYADKDKKIILTSEMAEDILNKRS